MVLGGCTLAPKYTRPEAPVPAEWPKGAAYQKAGIGPTTEVVPVLRWQEFIADDNLRQIIRTALQNNRDLRIAALNVERARAMYGIRQAELLPTVNLNANFSEQRVPPDLTGTGTKQIVRACDVNLGVASWEIDFFGRIRSLKDRALQEYLASEQARRSTQILLVSSLAQAYLTLAADRDNLALAETTLVSQQGAYDLVKRRYSVGLTPELELYRAQTPVDVARRDVVIYTKQVAQDENTLNLLAGSQVPASLLPATLDRVSPPKEIAPGLSSEVLLNRPDVLQAESQLKAANADIGAARAAFFPRISLTAAIGTASDELSGLFKGGSDAWTYAPRIVMPIFDARTWSAFRASKVQQQIVVTQYEKAIQSAFKEVADALAVRGTVDQEVDAQKSLVKALTETHRLSFSRYNKGIDSYLGVLDAQRSLFAAQQVLVVLRLSKLSSQVKLYAVLGGGWEGDSPSEDSKPVVPARIGDIQLRDE
ncbi:MAG: efflux transporter outer membrane subunit [Verrucomicrobiae bacterium]|nr:efflux transporter outer membrane subunit [Verrucomicrobiae bacterium]